MFDKNIDLALIGKNYLSLLMGLSNLTNHKNVLLLDDERYRLGEDYLNGINEFEKKFLDAWIEKQGLSGLVILDDFIHYQDIVFIVGDKRLRLGRNYWNNLFELVRKLDFRWNLESDLSGVLDPGFKSDFNQLMEYYLEDLVARILETKLSAHKLYELFISTAPEMLKHVYQVVKSGFLEGSLDIARKDSHLQALLFAAKGFYQYDTDNTLKDEEFFHLFISMLVPFYQIDHKALIDCLLNHFTKQNGAFKKAMVESWNFVDNHPWAIELSSYEGIVHPHQMALFFGHLTDPHFKLSVETPFYRAIKIKHSLKKATSTFLKTKYVICSPQMVGTDKPFWWLTIENDHIHFKCFIEYKKGCKLSFIQKDLETFFCSEMKKYFPDLILKENDQLKVNFDDDICMMNQIKAMSSKHRPALTYIAREGDNILTRNLYYLGPYNKRSSGLISTLMEMNIISYNEL